MDQHQERQINEAAEKFADAITESYRTVSERAVSAQERNAELTQNFFNSVISNLRTQAESNREATRQLAEQQQKQREARQTLTQEAVNSYMEFVNSMFSYSQGNIEQVQQQAEQAQRQAANEEAVAAPEPSPSGASEGTADVESLLENYDSMNVGEVSDKLDELSVDEIRQLRDYEAQNKNRSTLIERFDLRLEAGSS